MPVELLPGPRRRKALVSSMTRVPSSVTAMVAPSPTRRAVMLTVPAPCVLVLSSRTSRIWPSAAGLIVTNGRFGSAATSSRRPSAASSGWIVGGRR